jgi:hypothetical protein
MRARVRMNSAELKASLTSTSIPRLPAATAAADTATAVAELEQGHLQASVLKVSRFLDTWSSSRDRCGRGCTRPALALFPGKLGCAQELSSCRALSVDNSSRMIQVGHARRGKNWSQYRHAAHHIVGERRVAEALLLLDGWRAHQTLRQYSGAGCAGAPSRLGAFKTPSSQLPQGGWATRSRALSPVAMCSASRSWLPPSNNHRRSITCRLASDTLYSSNQCASQGTHRVLPCQHGRAQTEICHAALIIFKSRPGQRKQDTFHLIQPGAL